MYLKDVLFLTILIIKSLIQTPLYAQTSGSSYVKAIYSIPLSLDPIKMNDTASLAVGNLLYDGLLKFSPTLKIESALARLSRFLFYLLTSKWFITKNPLTNGLSEGPQSRGLIFIQYFIDNLFKFGKT